jgi:hypothetical protein
MSCGCSEGLMFGGAPKKQTKEALYAKAKALDIKGRSKMNKDELSKAIKKASKKKN